LNRSKAVSDGAVSFYLDHFVQSRVSKPPLSAAAGGSAGRQDGHPREPRPASNAKEPPPVPPHSSLSGPDSSRARYLGKFLPSSTSSSDPAREEKYHRLLADHQRLQSDLKRAESDNRHLKHANREIDLERLRHRENATTLQNELLNVQRELEDYRNLSEIRGKELMGAQVFLADNQRLQSDLKRAESDNLHLKHANRENDQDRLRHRENATTLQNELLNVQRELEDYRNLSEIRGKELQAYRTS
jgi:hypothetical protein